MTEISDNKRHYDIKETKSFRHDYRNLEKSGYLLEHLDAVIDCLAAGGNLPLKYKDHALTGNFRDYRECHIGPDWLLMYQRNKKGLVLVLIRTGTHAQLFK